MINAIRPWLSSADIDAGARWGSDVARKLEKSKVGILCLTPSNLESIWIHFEAGAMAKTIESTYVCPYLVGVEPSDLKGPLTQFQAKRSNEEDTKRLLETLNAALAENAIKSDQLAEAFSVWYPKLREKLEAIGKEEPPPKKRSKRDMIEELLALARSEAQTEKLLRIPDPFSTIVESVFGPGYKAMVYSQSNELTILDEDDRPLGNIRTSSPISIRVLNEALEQAKADPDRFLPARMLY